MGSNSELKNGKDPAPQNQEESTQVSLPPILADLQIHSTEVS